MSKIAIISITAIAVIALLQIMQSVNAVTMTLHANVTPIVDSNNKIFKNLEMKNTKLVYADEQTKPETNYTFINTYPTPMVSFTDTTAVIVGKLATQTGSDTIYKFMPLALNVNHVKKSQQSTIMDLGDSGSSMIVGNKSYPIKGTIVLTDNPATSTLNIHTIN